MANNRMRTVKQCGYFMHWLSNIRVYWVVVYCILIIGYCSAVFCQDENETALSIAAQNENLTQNDGFVSLDFNKVDIRVVIKFISELTGKNFIIDENISGTITIVCPTKIAVKEVERVFESILETKGFTAITSGDIVKIIPIKDAQQKNIEVRVGRDIVDTPEGDKVVTQIIPLDYIPVAEAVNLLTPLKSPNTNLVTSRLSNSLMITDSSANLKKLVKIINEIDNESQKNVLSIIPLKFSSAAAIEKVIESLLEKEIRPGRKIKVFADTRMNSLVVSANKEDYEFLENLVSVLDREVPLEQAEIRVYYVKNADAQQLAEILSKTFTQIKGRTGPDVPGKADNVPTIVADKNTNSLIITGATRDYLVLKKVIDQIDIKAGQVLVEAVIAEITLDKTKQLGIEWSEDFGDFRDKNFYAGTDFGIRKEAMAGTLSGFNAGLMEGENVIGALLQAYQKDTDVNILSTPHILANDNQEAEINIGKVIPILKDSRVSDQESVIRTFEYKDVGIKLKITPHINPEGYVRLEISQEIQDLLETTLFDSPLMTKRQANTVVTVKDGKTVVIGGLISENKEQTFKKLPILGDIPLLGWLFKRKTWTTEKTNLLIFITPHVLRTDEQIQDLTRKFQDNTRKAIENKSDASLEKNIMFFPADK